MYLHADRHPRLEALAAGGDGGDCLVMVAFNKREHLERLEVQRQRVAIAEQLTMALDSCKGNPELLTMVQDTYKRRL